MPCELHHLPILVRFDSGSAALSEMSRAILDQFIDPYLHAGVRWRIRVEGYADRAGPAPANRRLSRRRAQAARDYLVEHGIPPGRIRLYPYGERQPMSPTADGVADEVNRVVAVIEQVPAAETAARVARGCRPHDR